jgi:UDP-N-acetylglucosamine acyltransferase
LSRRGFSQEALQQIKRAYKIIYHSGKRLEAAREEVEKLASETPELKILAEFLSHSGRGILR